jgi:hypothetical protein
VAFVTSGAACALYDSSLLLPAPTDGTGDGGGDAAPVMADGSSVQQDAGCIHSTPPAPPAKDDPSTDNLDFVIAANFMRVVVGGAAMHPASPSGFDLDGVCTCPGPPSCTGNVTKTVCDLDGGSDDVGGLVFGNYATLDPSGFSDMGISTGMAAGANGLVYRVKNYNGQPNDTQVSVIAYQSSGIRDVEGGVVAPVLDGTDVWTVAPNSLLGGDSVDGGATCEGNDSICVPVFFDTNAYVSNGVVVAHVDHPLFLGFTVSRIQMQLKESVVVLPLVKSGSSFHVDEGRISGRWCTTDFLTSLQSLGDPLDPSNAGLCGDSGTYQNLKSGVCAAADMTSDKSKDNTGAACDSFSMQVAFTAVPAHIGAIFAQTKLRQPCGTTYSDSCP